MFFSAIANTKLKRKQNKWLVEKPLGELINKNTICI
jgi:hypothetical protein